MQRLKLIWLFHRRTVIYAASLLLVCTAALVWFCVGSSEPVQTPAETEEPWIDEEQYDPLVVETVPAGYIPFEDAVREGDGILFYSFFETHLFADDEDGERLGCWPVADPDVLVSCGEAVVSCRETYYINQSLHNSLLTEAKARSEEYNRVHYLGETVSLRRADPHYVVACRYTVRITSAEDGRIRAKLTNEGHYTFDLVHLLHHVETAGGEILTEFHAEAADCVRVDLKPGDSIAKIVLKIPSTTVTRVVLAEERP